MLGHEICEGCPAKTKARCIRQQGQFDLAVVLDYPTHLEVKKGKLLTGDTGRLVRTVLQANGIDDGSFYITSALNCRPGETKETTLRNYMEHCRPRLVNELRAVGAKKVLCLGPVGYSALMSSEKIVRTVKQRGRWKQAWGMKVILTYSPIVVLADAQFYRDFAADIVKFVETDGREQFPQIDVWIPKNRSELLDAFDELESVDELSADFETNGFSPIDNEPIALGYAWVEDNPLFGHAVVINRSLLEDRRTWQWIARQLRSAQTTIYHNMKFDLKFKSKWLEKMGLRYKPNNVHDTMLLSYLQDERTGGDGQQPGKYEAHNLEGLARRRYDAPDYGIHMGNWLKAIAKITDPKLLRKEYLKMHTYCGVDCYYTVRLFPDLYAELEDESDRLLDVYHDILLPGTLALADVELRGIRLRLDKMAELRSELVEKEGEKLEAIRDYVQDPEFNPGSSKQMFHFMYHELQLPPTSTPRRGKLQEGPTSAAVMRILRDKFPEHAEFFADVMEWRTLKKAVGTFVDGMTKRVSSDGRLRSDLLLHGTETGRLSSRNPNLQNVQEVSRHNIDVRACFVPTDDDWVLLEADYSQLELRVAAHLSGDKDWLQVYLEDRDLHQDVAGALYGKPKEEITTYQRWLAKNTVFGAMYGRGAESLALGPEMDYVEKVYGGRRWTLEEAKQYFENFFNRYKGFKSWIDDQHRTAYRQHYIESAFGRRRRFPFIPRNDNGLVRRQAVNTPIQSTASDITLSALVRIHHRLLNFNEHRGELCACVVLTIHDSVLVECKKKVKKTVMEIMREEMEENVPLESKVPFKVDVHAADSWSGLK